MKITRGDLYITLDTLKEIRRRSKRWRKSNLWAVYIQNTLLNLSYVISLITHLKKVKVKQCQRKY